MKQICLNWTVSLLTGFFVLFLLSSFGFVFNLPINSFYLPIAVFAGVFLSIYLTFKQNRKGCIKSIFAQFIVFFDFILVSSLLCYFIPDVSYDGTTYHQAMIILLKLGLNPIFDNVRDFAINQEYVFTSSIPYVENFLKFFEIIGANIYLYLNKIELTKVTNYIFMLAAFCYSFYTLKNFNLNNFKSLMFASILIYNPVCICQMLSNYVDAVFYYVFLILLFALINYVKGEDKNFSMPIILMSSVIFANIKLTGAFTLIIMLAVFFAVYRSKDLLKVFSISLVLIILTGINPYFTNIMKGRSPFYPVIQDSVLNANREFMITSYPPGFEKMNRLQKFLFSTFAVSKNLSPLIESEDVPRLKIPFTIDGDDKFIFEDMRLGGFGYFFSGILLVSLFLSMFLRFKNKDDKKLFFAIISVLIISILGNHEAWWSRFIPQFWTLPIFICLFMFLSEQTADKCVNAAKILIGICFLNSLIINVQYFSYIVDAAIVNREFIKVASKSKILEVPANLPVQLHKYETMPVKLAEYGIKVIYKDEN